jgi:cob(I)alamin adenosyltransferase
MAALFLFLIRILSRTELVRCPSSQSTIPLCGRRTAVSRVSIATKTGDKGETSLMYGRRVAKSDHRVDAYGCVDELNSALGLARAAVKEQWVREQILTAQKELITVMGELATAPEDLKRYEKDHFAITASSMVDRVTAVIDELEKDKSLHPNDWVIPGSSLESAALDLARTTCRRAERRVATLENINPEILRYLNRLSDLCWLLARKAEKTDPASSR